MTTLRHKAFQSKILGQKEEECKAKEVDIRNYAKYLLREGADVEKRELLGCLRSKILLSDKTISLG